jgi:hypothetical protein
MNATETEMAAAFAVELARNEALRHLSAQAGKETASLLWRMGWVCGKQAGLEQAERIMKPKAAS